MAADVTVAPTLGHAILMTQGGVGATPGYDAIDLRRMVQAADGGQKGVYDATGWKVSENAGSPNMTVQVAANVGLARVDGVSVTHQGPYIVAPHSAVITLDVATAHSTNPRIDMVVLHVRDNTHDALGANDARARILSGTATSGATLDNLNGQASLPSNAIRLADVLVPAADTTISNAQVRDRRLWARGIEYAFVRTTGSFAGFAAFAAIDPGTGSGVVRLECSGVPVVVTFGITYAAPAAARNVQARIKVDGTAVLQRDVNVPISGINSINLNEPYVPAPGSRLFAFELNSGAGDGTFASTATQPLTLSVAEVVRQNANNGAA